MEDKPKRYESLSDYERVVPIHVVWETTLACNLSCQHCGSRAGKRRAGELSTDECFEIIEHLSLLGTREITLIGGEVFLRPDWLQIIRKITESDIDCSIQTGAYNLNEKRIVEAKKSGVKNVGVSLDGTSAIHNEIRGKRDSFDHAINALMLLGKHGIVSSVNTVITQSNKDILNELLDILIHAGVKNWQVQLAVAMGNAVDNEYLLIQPYQVKKIQDSLFELYRKGLKHNLLLQPGNNIGYYGPYEGIWRQGEFGHWNGCAAGHTTLGIEADGKIKGCPSLPTSEYTGGNVRDMSISDIWKYTAELSFTRYRKEEELWGFCKSCYYSKACNAGCTWTSHVLFGRRGNNPYCYHRVSELEKKGLRERIVKIENGDGSSFDHGIFKIEILDTNGIVIKTELGDAREIPTHHEEIELRKPMELILCRSCERHIYPDTIICPFCGDDTKASQEKYREEFAKAQEIYGRVIAILNKISNGY